MFCFCILARASMFSQWDGFSEYLVSHFLTSESPCGHLILLNYILKIKSWKQHYLTSSEILNILYALSDCFPAILLSSGEYCVDVCLFTSWRQSGIIEYGLSISQIWLSLFLSSLSIPPLVTYIGIREILTLKSFDVVWDAGELIKKVPLEKERMKIHVELLAKNAGLNIYLSVCSPFKPHWNNSKEIF